MEIYRKLKPYVIVDGKKYRIKPCDIENGAVLAVDKQGYFIKIESSWYEFRISDGMIAHECGHLALGHHKLSDKKKKQLRNARAKGEMEGIQREIDADTWVFKNTPYAKQLLVFLKFANDTYPDDGELKLRLENLEKLIKEKKNVE